jgi:hypothetical protein
MFFPNDRAKAEVYATARLAGMMSELASDDLLELLPAPEMRSLLSASVQYAEVADEAANARYTGSQAGYLASYLWHALHGGFQASWEDAAKAAEKSSGVLKSRRDTDTRTTFRSGSRSGLMKAKSDFATVLHFWAVWSAEYANKSVGDIAEFISKAEGFLREMRNFEATGQLAGNAFKSSKIYVPIAVFNWPRSVNVRIGQIAENLLPEPKKSGGRPPKPRS